MQAWQVPSLRHTACTPHASLVVQGRSWCRSRRLLAGVTRGAGSGPRHPRVSLDNTASAARSHPLLAHWCLWSPLRLPFGCPCRSQSGAGAGRSRCLLGQAGGEGAGHGQGREQGQQGAPGAAASPAARQAIKVRTVHRNTSCGPRHRARRRAWNELSREQRLPLPQHQVQGDACVSSAGGDSTPRAPALRRSVLRNRRK